MARATWNGVMLADTSRPVLLEGNVHFPPEDARHEYLARTRAWSVCPWKGLARYYTVRAGGQVKENAAWYSRRPSPLARKIKNHVPFWNGVQVDAGAANATGAEGRMAPDDHDLIVIGSGAVGSAPPAPTWPPGARMLLVPGRNEVAPRRQVTYLASLSVAVSRC